MTLATGLYAEAEDRAAAVEMAKNLIAEGRCQRTGAVADAVPPSDPGTTSSPVQAVDLTAHNIALRFRDAGAKFSGNLGEAWSEYKAEYMQVARDYNQSNDQRLHDMHNILAGDAKRFLLDRVQGYATTFQQAANMINDEYNSIVPQNRVKNYLSVFHMSSLVAEGKSETAALAHTYKMITKLAPQVPRSHQGDAHKVGFLRNAVVGASWATERLSRIATHSLTFQQL